MTYRDSIKLREVANSGKDIKKESIFQIKETMKFPILHIN